MTILCEPDARAVAAIRAVVGDPVYAVASLADAAHDLANHPAEHVVVIGREAGFSQALDFAADVSRRRTDLVVFLLRDELNPAQIDEARRAGVHDLLPAGDLDLLAAAYQGAVDGSGRPGPDAAVARDSRGTGRVVTVFSPKGGTGKTTMATNLAVALHGGGVRRVCLLDLDLEFGDVAISMQLEPTRSLIDAVTVDVDGEESELVAALTTEFRSGLDCILAPIEPGDAAKIPAHVVTDLLALLRRRYDFVVIDTPSQFSEHVLAALDASDHHVLITNPELPSLKNLRLALDMLDLLGYPRAARSVVFNRSDAPTGLSDSDVRAALRVPIAAQVPTSRDVPISINRGVPIVAAKPGHPVSAAIVRFARGVLLDETGPEPRHRRLGRVFRRRRA